MSEIKQTSQAILFEEFNSSKDDLRTMLTAGENSHQQSAENNQLQSIEYRQ